MAACKHALLNMRRRQLARRDWRLRYASLYAAHPEFRQPCPAEVERAHRDFWKPLRFRFMPDTLRVCAHLSGVVDARYVPEELMAAEIETCLNHWPEAWLQVDKSLYHRFFPGSGFPSILLQRKDGMFEDADGNSLPAASVTDYAKKLSYPVVAKTSRGPGGGAGVVIAGNDEDLTSWLTTRPDCVVQPLLRQHDCMRLFSPPDALGLNTVRACVYRSVLTNEWIFLNAALRMGRSRSLDNEAAGGLACALDETGKPYSYAVDKSTTRYERHPDTGLVFAKAGKMPDWQSLQRLALELAAMTIRVRLISFDIYYGRDGRWRPIEINLRGHSIRFAQYFGLPFFGDESEAVRDFCCRMAG